MELLAAVATGIAARLHHAAGAECRIVVEALGVGGVLRVVQFIQRRGAEAFAVGATHHQLFERLVAERVFRVGGAAEVAVFIVAHGGRQFEAVEYRYVQFGVDRLDGTVTLDAAVRVHSEAGYIRRVLLIALMEFFLTELATNRQPGRACTKPVTDFTAHAAIESGHPAHGGGVLAVVLVAVNQRLAGCGLRAERVDDAVSNAVEHGRVADIPARQAGNHLVLVVRGANVVVPALGHAVKAQHQTLAGVLILGCASAGCGFTPVQIDGLGRVERSAGGARSDAVAGEIRRRRVHGHALQGCRCNVRGVVVAGKKVLEVGVVVVGDLAGGLAEK